ncbi:MAG: transposase family protein [Actinomycetota bacterium]|nr:transposase family protein [Actinomycetota bacterium]
MDRLLGYEKRKLQLKGRSTTKPGTLLKNKILVRTFSDWDEQKLGFLEIEMVSHDGGSTRGDFIQTLDATDICTTWTETKAVKNKAQRWVFEALEEMTRKVPFDVLGIDSDNGSEFINAHLLRFCGREKITFTRSRPYRKNDNCFVEQKNYSVVRKTVGYPRYDTEEELKVLNELLLFEVYTNFFQPTMKLVEKTRVGSKVKKRYDRAKTPFKRVLESPHVPEENKERLKGEYVTLNPAELKRKITKLQTELLKLATSREKLRGKQEKGNKDFEYIFDEATNTHFEYLFT